MTKPITRSAVAPVPISVLDKELNYWGAQLLAKDMGRRLPTLQEFITALKANPRLYEKSKGDGYWLGDMPYLEFPFLSKINYNEGRIESIPVADYQRLPPEQRAWVYNHGIGPIVLSVMSNSSASGPRLEISTVHNESMARIALVDPLDVLAESLLVESQKALAKLRRGLPR